MSAKHKQHTHNMTTENGMYYRVLTVTTASMDIIIEQLRHDKSEKAPEITHTRKIASLTRNAIHHLEKARYNLLQYTRELNPDPETKISEYERVLWNLCEEKKITMPKNKPASPQWPPPSPQPIDGHTHKKNASTEDPCIGFVHEQVENLVNHLDNVQKRNEMVFPHADYILNVLLEWELDPIAWEVVTQIRDESEWAVKHLKQWHHTTVDAAQRARKAFALVAEIKRVKWVMHALDWMQKITRNRGAKNTSDTGIARILFAPIVETIIDMA